MNKEDNVLYINKITSLTQVEEYLYEIFEGNLKFEDRIITIKVNFIEGLILFNLLFSKSYWIPYFNYDNNEAYYPEYWIAPNAIKVFIKILKNNE